MTDTPAQRLLGKRGLRMEYLVAAVFQGRGYFVRRGIPVKVGPGTQEITDVDVLAVRFDAPMSSNIAICDCKDKQRSRPFERILWTKGLGEYINVKELYVALPRSSLDLVNFAQGRGVRILNQELLEQQYSRMYVPDDGPYSAASQDHSEPLYSLVSKLTKTERVAATTWLHARSTYLANDPYTALNSAIPNLTACMEMIRSVGKSEELAEAWRIIAAELTVGISFLILKIAIDSIQVMSDFRRRYIIDRLTYGDVAPRQAERFWKLLREMSFEISRSSQSNFEKFPLDPYDIGSIEPPRYAVDVAGLVERIIASPSSYSDLPQVMDHLLFEQSLRHQAFSDVEFGRRFPLRDTVVLRSARNVLAFTRDAAGLDLRIFWPRERNNLPRIEEPELETRSDGEATHHSPTSEISGRPDGYAF
jgi:hypothetical protein